VDHKTFDSLTLSYFSAGSRRDALRTLLGALFGLPFAALSPNARAGNGAGIGHPAGGSDSRNKRQRRKRRDHRDGRKDKRKDSCAKAGQSEKPRSPCCRGLQPDASGRCAKSATVDQCDSSACPSDQSTASTGSGFCCPDGVCSCGGECCGGPDCWVVTRILPDREHQVVTETCDPGGTCVPCPDSETGCCSGCTPEGGCIARTPIGGGSIRRR
jgi:hypothetical protein